MEERTFRTTSGDLKGNKEKKFLETIPLTTESGYHLDKYKTATEAIKEWIKEPYDLSEIEDGVEGGIIGASDLEDVQAALNHKLSAEITRYLKFEETNKRNIYLAKKRLFEMGGEIYDQGPDAYVIDTKKAIIETIRYKTGDPSGMTKGIGTIKGADDFTHIKLFYPLYADIQYVVQNIEDICPEFADPSNPVKYTVMASFYFLKSSADKKGQTGAVFTEKNIVSIQEQHSSDEAKHNTELDDLFEKFIQTATTVGFECEPKDCTYCNYKSCCNYKKARVKLEVEDSPKDAFVDMSKIVLSPQQQMVIDAVLA